MQPAFEMERNAVLMLSQRVEKCEHYLRAVVEGRVQPNADILRRLESICRRLSMPLGKRNVVERAAARDCRVATMLAVATRGSVTLQEYIDKNVPERSPHYLKNKRNSDQYF